MLLKLYNRNNSPQVLQRVVDVLQDGGVIIYPTDTGYALGCHALKERVVERICRLKGLDPRKHRLSIVCYDLSTVSEYAKVDNLTFKLIKRHLPGPFTLILNGTNRLPKVFRNRKEVGIRMPANEIAADIARALEAPLMTSTLPTDDEGAHTHPELIHEYYSDSVDLVIDGGELENKPSTVVDLTGEEPTVTRQGQGIWEAL